ncbi:MAG: PucR family transcriptional regulator ligand-binding domain-containing protein, partial [Mogibacterium sp.]|nr:PucR family transcriptional regulator ligand-binding domain-containing protein [Mogibacterium sp.]
MKITIDDCLRLDAFRNSTVVSCRMKVDRRVRTVSVFDEDNIEMGVERNGVREQMVLTHMWGLRDDVDAQIRVVTGFGRKEIAALVVFLSEDGIRILDEQVIRAAEDSDLLMITVQDDGILTYSAMIEQVLDKVLYGSNYSDNILNNTIYHLLNFD